MSIEKRKRAGWKAPVMHPGGNGTATNAVLPSPEALLKQFRTKVADLRAALDNDAASPEAAEILLRLIESVMTYPDEPNGTEEGVAARMWDLLPYATNDNAARESGVRVFRSWLRGRTWPLKNWFSSSTQPIGQRYK
ncbi:toprim domain-containing protein [Sphingomonas trueperi]|uniref:toprim domain-containing protein n=1 Tax=Sphingomonas trueperi TaxID=53317 RepID=UPI0011C35D6D